MHSKFYLSFFIISLNRWKTALLMIWNKVKKKAKNYDRSYLDENQELAIYSNFIKLDLDSIDNKDNKGRNQSNN